MNQQTRRRLSRKRAGCQLESIHDKLGDLDDHVRLASELLGDRAQLESLQKQALVAARSYTLEREQALFHRFVEEYVLSRSTAPR